MVSTRRKTYHETVTYKKYHVNLLDLPEEILIKIIDYLPYKCIADIRPVCTRINKICAYSLKKGFEELISRCDFYVGLTLVLDLFAMSFKCDIMLSMISSLLKLRKSMMRYIEKKDCVFFPGKIIDKGHTILKMLSREDQCLCSIDSVYVRVCSLTLLCRKAEFHFDNFVKPLCLNLRSSAKLKKKYSLCSFNLS